MKPGLLVASPALDGSLFSRSVILLAQYSEEGAMGVVINRELGVTMGELMQQLEMGAPRQPEVNVMWGGPVEPGAGLVVLSGRSQLPEGRCVLAVEGTDLGVSASRIVLEDVTRGQLPGDFMVCLGYAGWGPGQLDQEISEGSWLMTDLDLGILFGLSPEERWQQCVASLGQALPLLWIPPLEE